MPIPAAEPLLIVGASARAAAESARRAGYRPYAIDLFADADLEEVAEVRLSRDFPYDIPSLAATVPACDWLYVGGLENYPDVVDALAGERRLLGCSGRVLRSVRDPRALDREFRRAGVRMPESIFDRAELERLVDAGRATLSTGSDRARSPAVEPWLVKRARSSGGLGVAAWDDDGTGGEQLEQFGDDVYLQRRIAGESFGAVYLATSTTTNLLGVSRQLTCPSSDGNRPFRYGGSVGPMPLRADKCDPPTANLQKIGSLATSVFPMSGIFSLDFLLDAGNEIRPLEINPRYSASCELIERSLETSLVGLHAAACRDDLPANWDDEPVLGVSRSAMLHGKRVVYATADLAQVPDDVTRALLERRAEAIAAGQWPDVGDLPRAGSPIRRDDPVATVFACGADEPEVLQRLIDREHELRDLLGC